MGGVVRGGAGEGETARLNLSLFAPGVCATAVAPSLSEGWLTASFTKESEYEFCAHTKASIVSNLRCTLQVGETEEVPDTGYYSYVQRLGEDENMSQKDLHSDVDFKCLDVNSGFV